MVRRLTIAAVMFLITAAPAAASSVSFSDNFNSGASALWGNQFGGPGGTWTTSNGVYYATNPTNSPTTYSLLPYDLTDFDFFVDVNSASDGGIWLHSDATRANALLLVFGGNSHTGTGFYFHQITGGSFGSPVGSVSGLFAQGANIGIHVNVTGNTYTVYLNGSNSAATSFTWASGPTHGYVGLYDFGCCSNSPTAGIQSFDNVVLRGSDTTAVTPEPASLVLFGTGLIGLAAIVRRRQAGRASGV